MTDQSVEKQRLDKWLFFARIAKSRTIGATLAMGGKVRVNKDKADKAAQLIKIGDHLTITLERRVVVYKVCALGTRRGPALEAQSLYDDVTPASLNSPTIDKPISYGARPTKKQRRQLDKFQEQNH